MNVTKTVKIMDMIDEKTQKTKTPHRIGRICTVYYMIGRPAYILYPNNTFFHTSTVTAFDENEYGFWITTLNTAYRFDYID